MKKVTILLTAAALFVGQVSVLADESEPKEWQELLDTYGVTADNPWMDQLFTDLVEGNDDAFWSSYNDLAMSPGINDRRIAEAISVYLSAWQKEYVYEGPYDSYLELEHYASGSSYVMSDKMLPAGALTYKVLDLDADESMELLIISSEEDWEGRKSWGMTVVEIMEEGTYENAWFTTFLNICPDDESLTRCYITTDEDGQALIAFDGWSASRINSDGIELTTVYYQYNGDYIAETDEVWESGSSFDDTLSDSFAEIGVEDVYYRSIQEGTTTAFDYTEGAVLLCEVRNTESITINNLLSHVNAGEEEILFGEITVTSNMWLPESQAKWIYKAENREPETVEPETELCWEDEYILPYSDVRLYTVEELKELTAAELRLARNEIFARHGRIFTNEELSAYFNSCSWYRGTVPAEEFDNNVLSSVEMKNVSLIVDIENGVY